MRDAAPVSMPEMLARAALALHDNALGIAEPLLKSYLKANPFDARAIRMLAELAARIGRTRDAETLLRRALDLSPGFAAARANLAMVLHQLGRPAEAIAELDLLLADDPDNLVHANLKAATLGRVGDFAEALVIYEALLQSAPRQPRLWLSYGHTLKTVGRQTDGIAAYRRAIMLAPTLGEAWWSLANLKTVRFTATDLQAMQAALDSPGLDDDARLHLHFACGKAEEDRGRAEVAFHHYAAGNALRLAQLDYSSEAITEHVDRSIAMFDKEFFDAHAGSGCAAGDPIFVLGMPRAGSTLVEQILASHPLVEGTAELPDLPLLARRYSGYPEAIAGLAPDELARLGKDYLARTCVHRRTNRPFFIDKLPNNWAYLPFLHLILPNARIIDVRRDAVACCFANFKQHYARGQAFSYSLADMGRYYRDYVRLMAHVDRVLPGRVHRVSYERLVTAPELEVRALIAACGLEFDAACLAFHETERPVRTASSEQVRKPLNRDGLDAWRPFTTWLDPLLTVLGDLADPATGGIAFAQRRFNGQ